jgi:hypothetical protein
MELITCQHEWVEQCQRRYRCDPPDGYWFEDAHYPLSKKLGGTETVSLWYPDHIVQGTLQTLEYSYPCIFTRNIDEPNILSEVYPEYVDLYQQAEFICKSYAGSVSGRKQWENQLGMFGMNEEDLAASRRKGGEVTQKILGPLLGLSLEQIQEKNIKSAKTQKERKTGFFGMSAEDRTEMSRAAVSKTNSQKWADPDHPDLGEQSSGTWVQMQKRRGSPPGKENRTRVY